MSFAPQLMDSAFSQLRIILVSHPLVVAVLTCLLFVAFPLLRPLTRRPIGAWTVAVAASLFIGLALLGPVTNSYADHIEPAVISASVAYRHGVPLYGHDSASAAGLPYGPALFLVFSGWTALFGAAAAPSRALSAGVAVIALVLQLRASKHHTPQAMPRLVVCLLYLSFGLTTTWVRAEPFLLLLVCLGLLSVRRGGFTGAVALGIAIGCATAIKVTAIVYFVPLIVEGWKGFHRKHALMVLALSILVSLLPFSLDGISLSAYLAVLDTTAKHGLQGRSVLSQVEWAVLLLFLPMTSSVLARRAQGDGKSSEATSRLALVAAVLITIIPATKWGAGFYHFLPFIPLVADMSFGAENRISRPGLRLARSAVIGTLMLLALTQSVHWARFGWNPLDRVAQEELATILNKVDGDLAVGYANHYRPSFARPLAVAADGVLPFEVAVLMDRQAAGEEFPPEIIKRLSECQVRNWSLPTGGEPFALINPYLNDVRVFPDEFVRVFVSTYSVADRGSVYNVWSCTPH